MQKRSERPSTALFQPIRFPEDIPVVVNPHEDPDSPVATMHYHDAVEISLCLGGSGVFFIGEEVRPCHEGTVLQLASGTLHIAQGDPFRRPRWLTVYLSEGHLGRDRALSPDLAGLLRENRFLEQESQPRVRDALMGLVRECGAPDMYGRLGLRGYLHVLAVELARNGQSLSSTVREAGEQRIRLAPALNLIARQLDRPLSATDLARSAGMSAPHFRRVFQSTMGQSPHQYLLGARIQLAKSLLTTGGLPVIEVAQRCGFETLSTFNRAFKRLTGFSPREWRRDLAGAGSG